ncbi:hypothetical protein GE061_017680 [Apolygus lucorum]|uniref:SWIM-type domain-containing protein n=1 Tax=Apolygus lucorum TaxID=248454 RepID=A0A8S9XBQ0_APOLU|nr:hypothetical protein GE061_017680 [Apolygus lucorum]
MQFESFDEFKSWKEETETSESCRFVMRGGKTVNKNDSNTSYFRCFRDGYFVSRGAGKRRPRAKGSCRIGGVCPASMKVTETPSTGTVLVKYVAQHVGHSSKVGRMFHTEKEKEEISSKLAAGVPIGTLLDSIRDSICKGELSRSHLPTRKDLWNIRSRTHPQNGFMLNSDDRVSVEAWLGTLANYSDVVRFYKGQSLKDPFHPELNEEDFVLILSLNSQLEMLSKFGNDCVCFDGTHSNDGYTFELTTLLVKDQKQGFPCAYMVSNRCDSQTMSLFIRVILAHLCSPITPDVIVSDTSDIYYNGWCSALPCDEKPIRWLYCAWHVDRCWKQNLTKIKDSAKKCLVYKMLRLLAEEPDEDAFSTLLEQTLNTMFADPDLLNFADYFGQEYVPYTDRWAFCFRKYCINTNMFLESVHKILKYYYLDGKKVKRLDKGLIAILKFTRDKLISRLSATKRGSQPCQLTAIRDRHKRSQALKSRIIAQENGWLISSKSEPELYLVSKQNVICDECTLRCELCNVCEHDFKCTCMDAMKLNICKHIHRVVTYIRETAEVDQSVAPPDEEISENDFMVEEDSVEASILNDVSAKSQTITSSNSKYEEKKQALLRKLTRLVEDTENCAQLEEIEKALLPLPHTISALKQGPVYFRAGSSSKKNQSKLNRFTPEA